MWLYMMLWGKLTSVKMKVTMLLFGRCQLRYFYPR